MAITIGDMATALRCHERTARSMVKGVYDTIEVYNEDLTEIVPDECIVDLIAARQDTRTKTILGQLLKTSQGTQDVLVRGIDARLYQEVRREVLERGTSINQVLRDLLNRSMERWLEGTF